MDGAVFVHDLDAKFLVEYDGVPNWPAIVRYVDKVIGDLCGSFFFRENELLEFQWLGLAINKTTFAYTSTNPITNN